MGNGISQDIWNLLRSKFKFNFKVCLHNFSLKSTYISSALSWIAERKPVGARDIYRLVFNSVSTIQWKKVFYLVAVAANSEVIIGVCAFSRRKTYLVPYTAWSFDDDKSCSIVFSLWRGREKVSTALQKIMKLIFPFKLGPSFSEKSSNMKTLRRVLLVAIPF